MDRRPRPCSRCAPWSDAARACVARGLDVATIAAASAATDPGPYRVLAPTRLDGGDRALWRAMIDPGGRLALLLFSAWLFPGSVAWSLAHHGAATAWAWGLGAGATWLVLVVHAAGELRAARVAWQASRTRVPR